MSEKLPVIVRDAMVLSVLSHPVRLRMLAAIGPDGTTSDRFHARFPEVPSDMRAWHLGKLESHGLIRRTQAVSGDRRLYEYRLCPEVLEGTSRRIRGLSRLRFTGRTNHA